MILEPIRDSGTAASLTDKAFNTIEQLYPICRSITGDGVRESFEILSSITPLTQTEVPSGTAVFDWQVPREWNVREAYVLGPNGDRVIDFAKHSLHLMNYSRPVRATVSLDELQKHLYSIPEHPDWIPYRTCYYADNWGFCMRHRDRKALLPGNYEVVVDTTLEPGHLTYAEAVINGQSENEAVVYTHSCHPSLANDNLTGLVIAASLAQAMKGESPRLTWRFVFGPGTIGSLTWLSRNESALDKVQAGLILGLLGDPGKFHYKKSRRGDCVVDSAATQLLAERNAEDAIVEFSPYGYDERQFCSPGFDLPFGRLTRSPNGSYPEYHSSADNLSLISKQSMSESLQIAAKLISRIDSNRYPLNLSPKGEPQLGKRGLYGMTGGGAPGELQHAMLWILNLADGQTDLLSMAKRSGLSFELLDEAALALEMTDLLESSVGPVDSSSKF